MLATLLVGGIRATTATMSDGGSDRPRPKGNTTLEEARLFRGFPVYFAGRAAAGYPLVAIMRIDRSSPAPHTEFTFIYGRCRSRYGQACSPPLTIISWPACYRYGTRYSIKREERRTVRGVPARLLQSLPRLELYPGGTTIIIQGSVTRAALLRVADSIRGVNTRVLAGTALPRRPPHVPNGARCRR